MTTIPPISSQRYSASVGAKVVYATLTDNTNLAAAGVPITEGCIVLDNTTNPPTFLGIADGAGNLYTATNFQSQINALQASTTNQIAAAITTAENRANAFGTSPASSVIFADGTNLEVWRQQIIASLAGTGAGIWPTVTFVVTANQLQITVSDAGEGTPTNTVVNFKAYNFRAAPTSLGYVRST
jgi:hypothetical protein